MRVELEVDQLRRLNDFCDRFESHIKNAPPESMTSISLTEFLAAENSVDGREAKFLDCLVTELLVIELLYLQKSGLGLDEARSALEQKYSDESVRRLLPTALEIAGHDPDTVAPSIHEELSFISSDTVLAKRFDVSPIPDSILRYRLIKRLGASRYGRSYLAHDPAHGKVVVVKTFELPFEATGEQIDAAVKEIARVRSLRHESISPLLDLERDDDLILVSQYLELPTLENVARSGKLPFDRVLEIFVSLIEALSAAHEKEILHGSLTSEVIFIEGSASTKMKAIIKDFAWKKSIGELFRLVRPDEVDEQESFPATEYAQTSATPAGDIFALGLLMQKFDRPKADTSRACQLPRWFQKIIERCLATNAEDSYESIFELSEELKRVLNSRGFASRLLGWLRGKA